MKNRKKTIISDILVCAIIVVFSYMYANIDKMNLLYNKNIDTSQYIATGNMNSKVLEQTFLCVENSLDGINLKCQVFGDISNVELKYELSENNSGKIVAEGEKPATELKNNQFNKLFFEKKVEHCNDENYKLRIQVVNATDDSGVGFFFVNEKEDKNTLTIGEDEQEGVLVAKTITKRFDLETFVVMIGFVVFIWVFLKWLCKLFK